MGALKWAIRWKPRYGRRWLYYMDEPDRRRRFWFWAELSKAHLYNTHQAASKFCEPEDGEEVVPVEVNISLLEGVT